MEASPVVVAVRPGHLIYEAQDCELCCSDCKLTLQPGSRYLREHQTAAIRCLECVDAPGLQEETVAAAPEPIDYAPEPAPEPVAIAA